MDIGYQAELLLEVHLKQFQQLSKHMQSQLMPAVEVQEALRELGRKALEPISAHQARWVAELQNSIQRSMAPAFEQLQRSFRELPPRTQAALLTLGAHGWYLDLHMPIPDLWGLESALVGGDVAEAETSLCEYFESNLERIEASISARFPHRAHLIGAAFSAHRRGEYVLSIPVLLAQTDGICKEAVGQYLFMKRDKKPLTATYVEQMAANSFRAALLSPLAQTLPINASEKERLEGSDALNRHEVLHGTSLDYGTVTNSLKAVSLVNYVATVVRRGAEDNA